MGNSGRTIHGWDNSNTFMIQNLEYLNLSVKQKWDNIYIGNLKNNKTMQVGIENLGYSKRILNKNIPLTKYLSIAQERGIEAAKQELEMDWKHRVISRSTYYRNRKILEKLERQVDFKELFLEFLNILANSNQEKFSKEELAAELGVPPEVIDNFKNWMDTTGYSKVARLVLKGKQTLKSESKAKQRSGAR